MGEWDSGPTDGVLVEPEPGYQTACLHTNTDYDPGLISIDLDFDALSSWCLRVEEERRRSAWLDARGSGVERLRAREAYLSREVDAAEQRLRYARRLRTLVRRELRKAAS